MNKFPERLKELREERKLSEFQLAKELGINQTTINRWERGLRTPNIEMVMIIAKYFKVSTDYLCGLED